MSKVLILGDGILGTEINSQTGWDYISRRKDDFNALKPNFNRLIEQEYGVIFYPKYDTIINCIANTDSYSDDQQSHLDINYKFVTLLSDFCNEWGIKLVHISTEFVYANNTPLPTETDLPIPDNTWYAKTKLLADHYISLMNKNYLICRELHKSNDFAPEKVWDIKTTGDKVNKIAKLIIELIDKKATGIFNIGTSEKSLLDISPNSELVPPPKHVPVDTRMDISKLNKFLNK
jgi:nucleoside-diphosphate-sugar epimerase